MLKNVGGGIGFAGIICGMLALIGTVWVMNNTSSTVGHAMMAAVFLFACYCVWGRKPRSNQRSSPQKRNEKIVAPNRQADFTAELLEAYQRQGIDITPYLEKPNPNPPAGSLSSVIGPVAGSIIDAGWQALRDEHELKIWTPEDWIYHNQVMYRRGFGQEGPAQYHWGTPLSRQFQKEKWNAAEWEHHNEILAKQGRALEYSEPRSLECGLRFLET